MELGGSWIIVWAVIGGNCLCGWQVTSSKERSVWFFSKVAVWDILQSLVFKGLTETLPAYLAISWY